MFGIEILNLKKENGRRLFYDKIRIQRLKREIEDFLEEESFMDDFNFSRKMMLSLEIKTNNAIEGVYDDIQNIEEVIQNSHYYGKDKNRILNLYYGYRFILLNPVQNKENLKKLYQILSKGLLDEYSENNMGEYYRNNEVFIMDSVGRLILSCDKGMSSDKVESCMNDLFTYLDDSKQEKLMDIFIKSQILHFYFVYVHPYYDVNGRTARTFSLWYLLRKKAYPFVIFNRGISLSKDKYTKSIKKSRRGDITPFLEYSLKTLKKELEKEKVIYDIRTSFGESLSKSEYEILEYILTSKSHQLQDVARLYRINNKPEDDDFIMLEKIYPLIEKGIVIFNEENQTLKISSNFITMNKRKVRQLRIKSYLS